MALVVKTSTPQIDVVSAQHAQVIAGNLYAGEALDAVAPCYINSDGTVHMCNGTAADAEAEIDGWTAKAYASGEAVTLYGRGVRAKYADETLTPGATYYLATTNGRLDTVATVGDAVGVAKAITDSDIRFTRDS